jgi:hypothetical protein
MGLPGSQIGIFTGIGGTHLEVFAERRHLVGCELEPRYSSPCPAFAGRSSQAAAMYLVLAGETGNTSLEDRRGRQTHRAISAEICAACLSAAVARAADMPQRTPCLQSPGQSCHCQT